MKIDKTFFKIREKREAGLADKKALSATIEKVVSSMLEIFIKYLKTILLISTRPFRTSFLLTSDIGDMSATSNPKTFLVISTVICSMFISLSCRIFIESGFDYYEIAYIIKYELYKTIKESTSLANVILTSFPGGGGGRW